MCALLIIFLVLCGFRHISAENFQPGADRAVTVGWASWVIPLLFTELILQLRRTRSPVAPGQKK